MNLYVDIGGTYFRYEMEGKVYKYLTSDIDILSFLQKLIDKYKIKNCVISFAGGVKDNRVIFSPNIGLIEFNKLKVDNLIVENDLNLAALAESRYFDIDNLIALYVGTGIGSGIVINNQIYKGLGLAGEVGHIPYKESEFKCGCGKNNCIELFSSGKALRLRGYKSLDEVSKEFFEEFFEGLMFGVSNLITLFHPKIIVLGGGVILNNKFLLDKIKQKLPKYALKYSLDTKIEITRLNDAPLQGAKILLKERI